MTAVSDKAPRDSTHAAMRPAIVLPVPEYDRAARRFLDLAIRAMMRAKDPFYAQLRFVEVEHVPAAQPRTDSDGDGTLGYQAIDLVASFVLSQGEIVQGRLDGVYLAVDTIADQMLSGFMSAMFSHVARVCDAAGNTIDYSGRPLDWDLLIDAFEQTEMTFDEQGKTSASIVMGPAAYERFLALPPPTPEQLRRGDAVYKRKLEAFRAQQRRRALPRLGD